MMAYMTLFFLCPDERMIPGRNLESVGSKWVQQVVQNGDGIGREILVGPWKGSQFSLD